MRQHKPEHIRTKTPCNRKIQKEIQRNETRHEIGYIDKNVGRSSQIWGSLGWMSETARWGSWRNDIDEALARLPPVLASWMVSSEEFADVPTVPVTLAKCSLRALYSASWVCSCCITSPIGSAWSTSRSPGLKGRIKCRIARVLTVTCNRVSSEVPTSNGIGTDLNTRHLVLDQANHSGISKLASMVLDYLKQRHIWVSEVRLSWVLQRTTKPFEAQSDLI